MNSTRNLIFQTYLFWKCHCFSNWLRMELNFMSVSWVKVESKFGSMNCSIRIELNFMSVSWVKVESKSGSMNCFRIIVKSESSLRITAESTERQSQVQKKISESKSWLTPDSEFSAIIFNDMLIFRMERNSLDSLFPHHPYFKGVVW